MSYDTLIFSDLHAHQWREFAEPVEYRGQMINSRLVDAAKVIDKARRLCEKHAIRRVVFAGDLFHRKRLIDVVVYNAVASALWRLARHVEGVYLLAGNHDLARRSGEGEYSEEHALHALGGHKKIHVIDKPSVIDGCGFVPYVGDLETFQRGVDTTSKAAPQVHIVHAGIAGAVTGPIEFQPLEPITLEHLPDGRVLSGHYHMPQMLAPKVSYIGAPLEMTWGDGYHAKRGYLLTTWGEDVKPKRVAYKGPSFLSVMFEEFGMVDVKGHFCRVSILSDTERHRGIDAIHKAYREAGARGFSSYIVEDKISRAESRLHVSVSDNTIPTLGVLCEAYVDQRADESLSPDYLRQLARTALAEAEVSEKG